MEVAVPLLAHRGATTRSAQREGRALKRAFAFATATTVLITGCSTTAPETTTEISDSPAPVSEPTAASPSTSATPSQVAASAPSAANDSFLAAEIDWGESTVSPRGAIEKGIGTNAGIALDEIGETMGVVFQVTEIAIDPECSSEISEAPQNGHYVVMSFDIRTHPELVQTWDTDFWVTAYDFQVFNDDGTRVNDPVGNAWSCLSPAEQVPGEIGSGQRVVGKIALDAPSDSGYIIWSPSGLDGVGWEWEF